MSSSATDFDTVSCTSNGSTNSESESEENSGSHFSGRKAEMAYPIKMICCCECNFIKITNLDTN